MSSPPNDPPLAEVIRWDRPRDDGYEPPGERAKPFVKRIKRAGDFLREYQPIRYVIDGVLPSGCIYSLTGKRGTGKTAFLLSAAMAIITGRDNLIGFPVEYGRVAYIALE